MVSVVLYDENTIIIMNPNTFEPVGHLTFEVDDFVVVRELILCLVEVVLVHVDVADGLELVRGGLRGGTECVVRIVASSLSEKSALFHQAPSVRCWCVG